MKLSTSTILLLLIIISSCNQEQPTGKITVENATPVKDSTAMFYAYTGDTILLTLHPDHKFENVFGIEWSVSPDQCGDIIYIQQPERDKKDFKEDRNATFFPEKEGLCTIYVSGFWKQTNPQHIDSVIFNIIPIFTDTTPEK